MKVIKVIESKVWRNKVTGARVSPYGACPWQSVGEREQWELVSQGWTWELDNGTIGLGRVPVKTREEAELVMRKINAR